VHTVVALALPAVETFDLAIPAQVFGDRIQASRYRFTVCSPTPGLVASTTGFAVAAEHDLGVLEAADTVVVPGYMPLDDPGEEVGAALRQAVGRGTRVVSVCTGAFALAAAGLLDHRRAATHWQYAGQLAARYPAVKVDPDVLWADEGNVLTSAGLAAGIDLCVQLVRADYGSEVAVEVARHMVVAPHREGGQAQWLQRPVPFPAASSPRPESRPCAGSPPPGCARPAGSWRSATCRSRLSPPALAWVAPRTCACTWRATPGPRLPPTGPPTVATIRTRGHCRTRTSRHQTCCLQAES
jgi:putative intracellular protease/amidase